MKVLVFDIETGAESVDELTRLMPEFKAPANYSKKETIEKYIQEAKNDYLAGTKASLSAVTGNVLAIGYCEYDTETKVRSSTNILEGSEYDILTIFWNLVRNYDIVVGFNSNYFDIPFCVRRSWKLRVEPSLLPVLIKGKYLEDKYIDLVNIWNCGAQNNIKLDYLAKYLNVGAKNGDGAAFGETYKTNRTKAVEYLINDIDITFKVAQILLGWK